MKTESRCCATCGFLGIKSKATGVVEIADFNRRQSGSFKTNNNPDGDAQCGKSVCDLPAESLLEIRRLTNNRSADASNPDAIKNVIWRVRTELECSRWTPFEPNLSPNEHDERSRHNVELELQRKSVEAQAAIAGLQEVANRIQQASVTLREDHYRMLEAQFKEQSKWEQQQQALHETRHQELRRDAQRFAKESRGLKWWEITFLVIATILAGVITSLLTVWLAT